MVRESEHRSELSARVGANIRDARESLGLSKRELAAVIGADRASLSLIERGRGNPTISMIERIARGLGVPVTDLFEERL